MILAVTPGVGGNAGRWRLIRVGRPALEWALKAELSKAEIHHVARKQKSFGNGVFRESGICAGIGIHQSGATQNEEMFAYAIELHSDGARQLRRGE